MKYNLTLTAIEWIVVFSFFGIIAAVVIPACLGLKEKENIADSKYTKKPLHELYSEDQLNKLAREYLLIRNKERFIDKIELISGRPIKVTDLRPGPSKFTDWVKEFSDWVRKECPSFNMKKQSISEDW